MLKVNLAGIDREDVQLSEQIPVGDPFWEGMRTNPVAPLQVELRVNSVGDGVLARGRLSTEVELECRRCLKPVRQTVKDSVDMLFASIGEDEPEIEGEVYPLPARGTELDLTEAVREQLLLRVPEYALCDEACRGLCPTCGTNRNEGACDCVHDAPANPWDALKQIKFD